MNKRVITKNESTYDEGWEDNTIYAELGGEIIVDKNDNSPITDTNQHSTLLQTLNNKVVELFKRHGIFYRLNSTVLENNVKVGPINVEYKNGIYPWLNIDGAALKPSMPSELIDEILELEYKYGDFHGSPYNYKYEDSGSYYVNCPNKSWGNTPNGCIRISDHWNFWSRGAKHCRTKQDVHDPFNDYWFIGIYDEKEESYEIIAQFDKKPNQLFDEYMNLILENDYRLAEINENYKNNKERENAIKIVENIEKINSALKKENEDILAKKEGFKNYEDKQKKLSKEKNKKAKEFALNRNITGTVTKRTYHKARGRWVLDSEETYEGTVIGKTNTTITIVTANGNIIKGKDYTINSNDLPEEFTWEEIPNFEFGGKIIPEYELPEVLKKVMPLHQQRYLKEIQYSEHVETLNELAQAAEQLKARNDKGADTVMYLHYFYGGADWYISEWQKEDDIFFGFANLGDDINAEWGSVFRKELVENGRIELDFYFTPEPIKNIEIGGNHYYEPPKKELPLNPEREVKPKEALTSIQTFTPEQIANANAANPLSETQIQNADINIQPYHPESDACFKLKTSVPESMWFDIQKALAEIDRKVRGVDQYVAEKLGYVKENCTNEEWKEGMQCLCKAFAAEQVDALAMAIYNIEEKGQGLICADMTGIGKGRVAAGIMRYAVINKIIPLFFTEKPNLFSDIYRDIIDIGSDAGIPIEFLNPEKQERKINARKSEIVERIKEDIEDGDYEGSFNPETIFQEGNEAMLNSAIEEYRELYFPASTVLVDKYSRNPEYEIQAIGAIRMVPFIVNGSGEKTNIKDKNGNIIYKGLPGPENNKILESKELPAGVNAIVTTYSQIASGRAKKKREFISHFSKGGIIVMDESHNASGDSNTGGYLRGLLKECKGVIYLSATYAKRPDNMPVYAVKTAMSEVALNDEQLIESIKKGGTALQEIVSSQLASEGQLIRRERSFADTEVIYMNLDESQNEINPKYNLKNQHRALFDQATEILREIINFQTIYVRQAAKEINKEIKAEQKSAGIRQGTDSAGISLPPEFSGVFNIINQLLFSIKAKAIAQLAIDEIKLGRKPLIAFSSTMESFLDSMENEDGSPVRDGDIIITDFSAVFMRRFNGIMRMSITDSEGNTTKGVIPLSMLSNEGLAEYERLRKKIKTISTGIHISPIDVVIDEIEKAGYSVAEITGRQRVLKLIDENQAKVVNRVRQPNQDIIRKFQDNEIECILLNQSGSTGISAHAVPTDKVNKEQVRPRTMLVLQFELNINTEIQKRGRIFRTGQIYPPKYIYVSSSVPAEQRMNLMLQRKLKSLDANTTSNQDQNEEVAGSKGVDFLNKYGDELVYQFLIQNRDFNKAINDPLHIEDDLEDGKEPKIKPDAAYKVAGRVAILPIKDQEVFYITMSENYISLVESLKETDEYDLKVEKLHLEAHTIGKQIAVMGVGGKSVFSRHTILEECEVNVIKKPYSIDEIKAIIKTTLTDDNGELMEPGQYSEYWKNVAKEFFEKRKHEDTNKMNIHYQNIRRKITEEEGYKKAGDKHSYEKERNESIDDTIKFAENRIAKEWDGKNAFIRTVFNSFIPGQAIAYPSLTYVFDGQWQKAIFLGWGINMNSHNPFAPGVVKMRIAFPSNKQYVGLPLSKNDTVMTIKALTEEHISYDDAEIMLASWAELTKQAGKERVKRYIVTGNILQAYKNELLRGRLIRYTLLNGMEKKGILLPETFSPSADFERDKKGFRISVPIIKAAPIIKSLGVGKSIPTTDNGIALIRYQDDEFAMLVPANRQAGGQFYLDPDILAIERNGNFNKVADKMRGYFSYSNLDKLLSILQHKFQTSVSLPPALFEIIADTVEIEDYPDEEVFIPDKTTETIQITHPAIQHFERTDTAIAAGKEINADKEVRLLKAKYQLMKLINMI